MDQAAEINYDGFLAKAHLVQAVIGAAFGVWVYMQMGDSPVLLSLVSVALFCMALAGVLFIRTRSVLAYPLFMLFNAAQLVSMVHASGAFGLTFGLVFNLSFSYESTIVRFNTVAAALLALSVIAWNDFLKRRRAGQGQHQDTRRSAGDS